MGRQRKKLSLDSRDSRDLNANFLLLKREVLACFSHFVFRTLSLRSLSLSLARRFLDSPTFSPSMSGPKELSFSQCHSASTLHLTAFTWTIDHFSYRKDYLSTHFYDGKRIKCEFRLYTDSVGYSCFYIYTKFGYLDHVKFKVSFIGLHGKRKLLYGKKNFHFLQIKVLWAFYFVDKFCDVWDNSKIEPSKFSRDELLDGYLPDDILTLHCEVCLNSIFAFLCSSL